MARFNTNVSAKSHERVKLGGFRGIDTSSAPIEVENYRSTEMRNMISRNGLNRKRHGWEQQELNINKVYPNTFGGAVQGIYGFKFAGETDTRTMVYANCKLWHQPKKGEPFVDITPKNVTTLKDRPCQFYLIGDALYIIGIGDFLVFDGYECKRVSENAYVPTTVINIVSDEYVKQNNIQRETLDKINLLTPYVKNEIIGNLTENETFTLDNSFTKLTAKVFNKETGKEITNLILKGSTYVKIEQSTPIGSCFVPVETMVLDNEYVIKINKTYESGKSYTLLDLSEGKGGEKHNRIALTTYNDTAKIYVNNIVIAERMAKGVDCFYVYLTEEFSNQVFTDNGVNYIDLGIKGFVVSYISTYIDLYNKATDVLTNEEGTWANVNYTAKTIAFTKDISAYKIELTLKTDKDYSRRITECSLSEMFGVDGHSDRLFVSGNRNRYNDWEASHVVQWSEIDNYTYFPDVNYTRLGTQSTAINGMQRLNDDSLCLFKESSTTEPTIYVMYGEYNTDKEGNTTNIFRTYAGNVAEGLIAPNSTGNLAGDILMLSSNGVYGVEMDANVVSTSKYTKERGLPIKRFIKEYSAEELKKACSIVRDDRYILCIGDKCFVAESRYSYKPKGSPRDTFSYEWYVWDNIPALCFSEIDGELYFGTADGRLCKFDDKFTDRTIEDFGTATVGYTNPPFITVDSKIEKDDTIHIKCKGLTGRIGTFEFTFDTTNKTFEFTYYSENRLPFYIGQELLIDSPLLYLTITDLLQILDDNNQFAYKVIGKYKPKFEDASIKNGKKPIFIFLDNKFCKVLEPDISNLANNQVKVSCDDFTFNLFWNAETTNNICNVYKYTESNVVAEWYSNTIDFGVPDYSKTLLGFTVVPERIEGDSVQFGYITREVDNESDVKQLRKSLTTVTENPLNLDGLSLYLLSFNTFQTSFTKKVKVRNFNYLMWFFKSDSPTDTAINNVLFDYKINHKNKGVN